MGGNRQRGRAAAARRRNGSPVVSAHLRLGSGGEFDRLRAIFARLGPTGQALGDDCALLRAEKATIALSIDMSVENVHLRHDWLTLSQVGYGAGGASADGIE